MEAGDMHRLAGRLCPGLFMPFAGLFSFTFSATGINLPFGDSLDSVETSAISGKLVSFWPISKLSALQISLFFLCVFPLPFAILFEFLTLLT
jgi:hypothetical protein